jgi:hypothetical protein
LAVAEDTLRRLARLLAGVVLTEGHLGHQVLGQLLIFDATEVEVAGANLAMAATSRQRSAFAQVAIRTAVPALALQALLRKREKRLETRERRLAERARRVSEAHLGIRTRRRDGQRDDRAARCAQPDAGHAEREASQADAAAKLAELDAENRKLREELAALRAPPGDVPAPPPVPGSSAPPDAADVPPTTPTGRGDR